MVTYEVFKELMKNKIGDMLPEEYRKYGVEINKVQKVNVEIDGLRINLSMMNMDVENNLQIVPTLYVKQYYDDYLKTENMNGTFKHIADDYSAALSKAKLELAPVFSGGNLFDKSKIIMQLVNADANEDMLKTVPHRQFMDLAVIYRVIANIKTDGINTFVVNSHLAKQYDVNEQELFDLAYENTRELLGISVLPMCDVWKNLIADMGGEDIQDELSDLLSDLLPKEMPMYIISNNCKINGAAVMVYEDVLHELSQKYGNTAMYIMPSTINEVIAVSANNVNQDELADMVRSINDECVEVNERLSNQVYFYDPQDRKLVQATNSESNILNYDSNNRSI